MTARHSERGSSLVETAIVLSVFLMLMFGIMDFGRALYTYHLVDNAARLGARFAIVRGSACTHTATPDPWPCPTPTDGSDIQKYVQQSSPLLGSGSMTVTTAWGSGGSANTGCSSTSAPYNGPGCLVTVTVSYPFQFLIPLVSSVTLTMSSSSSMIISQ